MNPTCRQDPRRTGSARTALLCAAPALPGIAAAAMPAAAQRVELAWKLEAGTVVVIGSSGTTSLADGAATSSPIPMRLVGATIVGTSRFDVGRGLLVGTESTMRMQASTAMGGQQTVIDTVTTLTLELIEGGD